MTTGTTKRLSDASPEELQELLSLVGSSDSVELKVTLPAEEHRNAIRTLGLDPMDAQIRQIFFFDTPDLQLYNHGIAVRARRIQGRSGDSVIKLRPFVPDELSEDVRRSAAMNVEVDAMPGGFVCSASMKGKISNEDVLDAVSGSRPIRKVFSKEQRAFYVQHAPEGLELDQLRILGPTFVLKEVVTPPKFGRRLVAEVWLLQDGSRILELSTKSAPNEAFQVAFEARTYLEGLGLDLSSEPQPKTKSVLEFFAAELEHEAATA
jgi:hypothetical protein